jgi:hypothetical protein
LRENRGRSDNENRIRKGEKGKEVNKMCLGKEGGEKKEGKKEGVLCPTTY